MAIDSNVVDLLVDCMPTPAHAEASESCALPPDYARDDPKMRRELFACYWLLSLAQAWQTVLYTFSDTLYAEVSLARRAPVLLSFAIEARENHPLEYRRVDPAQRPSNQDVQVLGVSRADAEHIVDAVGMGCDVFLTNDRRLRKRCSASQRMWGLKVRLPSEFLVETVRAGAPWPTAVPWPWDAIDNFVTRRV